MHLKTTQYEWFQTVDKIQKKYRKAPKFMI